MAFCRYKMRQISKIMPDDYLGRGRSFVVWPLLAKDVVNVQSRAFAFCRQSNIQVSSASISFTSWLF